MLLTIRSHRLVVRTTGFHPVNRGSIPLGTTNDFWSIYSFAYRSTLFRISPKILSMRIVL